MLQKINGVLAGKLTITQNLSGDLTTGQIYTILNPATEERLGGIIVGDDLLVTESGRLSVDKATSMYEDNTKPITAAAVYAEIGNIDALLQTI